MSMNRREFLTAMAAAATVPVAAGVAQAVQDMPPLVSFVPGPVRADDFFGTSPGMSVGDTIESGGERFVVTALSRGVSGLIPTRG
jgi:hypothetical protein